MFLSDAENGFFVDGSGWTTDFDGVVKVGRR